MVDRSRLGGLADHPRWRTKVSATTTNACYRCGEPATTREHFPPKAFFPRGGNLQLRTVPSCIEHNNGKSKDDQYLLTHICLHAAEGGNLPGQVFRRSILPALERSPGFRDLMNDGAEWLERGVRRYPVDTRRFDGFFDGFVHAIFFDRYGVRLTTATHRMRHVYSSLVSDDPSHRIEVAHAKWMTGRFFAEHETMVSRFEAAGIDDAVYSNAIVDPAGTELSITIAHVFYGVFEVVSLLTRIPPNDPLVQPAT
jgi:hypothetical protein